MLKNEAGCTLGSSWSHAGGFGSIATCFGSIIMFFLSSIPNFSTSQSHTNGVIILQPCSVFFAQCEYKNDMHLDIQIIKPTICTNVLF